MIYDVAIIGGGAAGLFCAIQAGRRGKKCIVLEHNSEVGRKILISGGGRCNFTNLEVSHENFVSQNPHFAKSALAGFSPADFIDLVRRHGISYYEKKLGQLFCEGSSRAIVDMLLAECRSSNVEIRTGCSITGVRKQVSYEVQTSTGKIAAVNLVVACGGLSYSKVGASDLGFRIADQFDIRIEPLRPSLVGLRTAKKEPSSLAGISTDASVTTRGRSFRENVLFTHNGLSGPAILQISNYWQKETPVAVDLSPDIDVAALVYQDEYQKLTASRFLGNILPQKLALKIADNFDPGLKLARFTNAERDRLAGSVKEWQVIFNDTEGYDRAEVTLGGISTTELSSKTMASNKVAGLYFIGEVVDVTGWLGGYNFQWAWASANAAAKAID